MSNIGRLYFLFKIKGIMCTIVTDSVSQNEKPENIIY